MVTGAFCGWAERIKMRADHYRGGTILIDTKPVYDILKEMMEARPPSEGDFFRAGPDEETSIRNQPISATLVFEKNRRKVLDSLKKIVDYTWVHYSLPKTGIVEYGSGATGFFDAELRPIDVPHWSQVELNSDAIAENKRRNPEAIVREGSYTNITEHGLSMIVGLSSWDATGRLPHVMNEVAKALKPGGYFLHFQDVRPGNESVLSYLERKIGNRPTLAWPIQNPNQPHQEIMGLAVGKQSFTTPELFRLSLEDSINSTPGLSIVENSYLSLQEVVPDSSTESLSMDLTEHYFFNVHMIVGSPGKELPKNSKNRFTTVLVTVARKN
jgi:hypothetical protein